MKLKLFCRIAAALLLLAVYWPAGAAGQTPFTLSVRDATSTPYNLKAFFTPQAIYGYSFPNAIYGTSIPVTATNGVISTNLNEGPYTISFLGIGKTLHVYVPGLWCTNMIPGQTLPVNLADPRWQMGAFQFTFVQTNFLTISNIINTVNITNVFQITNNLSGTNFTGITNAIPTNSASIIINQTFYYTTNYDAYGAAAAVQTYATAISNLVSQLQTYSQSVSNLVNNQQIYTGGVSNNVVGVQTYATAVSNLVNQLQVYSVAVSNAQNTASNVLQTAITGGQTYSTAVSNLVSQLQTYSTGLSNAQFTASNVLQTAISANQVFAGGVSNNVVNCAIVFSNLTAWLQMQSGILDTNILITTGFTPSGANGTNITGLGGSLTNLNGSAYVSNDASGLKLYVGGLAASGSKSGLLSGPWTNIGASVSGTSYFQARSWAAGANITIAYNNITGVYTITGAGSGNATNVLFLTSSNITWATLGGSNYAFVPPQTFDYYGMAAAVQTFANAVSNSVVANQAFANSLSNTLSFAITNTYLRGTNFIVSVANATNSMIVDPWGDFINFYATPSATGWTLQAGNGMSIASSAGGLVVNTALSVSGQFNGTNAVLTGSETVLGANFVGGADWHSNSLTVIANGVATTINSNNITTGSLSATTVAGNGNQLTGITLPNGLNLTNGSGQVSKIGPYTGPFWSGVSIYATNATQGGNLPTSIVDILGGGSGAQVGLTLNYGAFYGLASGLTGLNAANMAAGNTSTSNNWVGTFSGIGGGLTGLNDTTLSNFVLQLQTYSIAVSNLVNNQQIYTTGVSNNVVGEHTYAVGVSNLVSQLQTYSIAVSNLVNNQQIYTTGVSNNVVGVQTYATALSNSIFTLNALVIANGTAATNNDILMSNKVYTAGLDGLATNVVNTNIVFTFGQTLFTGFNVKYGWNGSTYRGTNSAGAQTGYEYHFVSGQWGLYNNGDSSFPFTQNGSSSIQSTNWNGLYAGMVTLFEGTVYSANLFPTPAGGGGGSATNLPSTTNLLKGNGSGGAADSGVAVASLMLTGGSGYTASGVWSGTFSGNGGGLSGIPFTALTGILGTSQFPALTGDITTTAGGVATALKNTGTAGTYFRTTFDAQGREISGTTTISSVTNTDGIQGWLWGSDSNNKMVPTLDLTKGIFSATNMMDGASPTNYPVLTGTMPPAAGLIPQSTGGTNSFGSPAFNLVTFAPTNLNTSEGVLAPASAQTNYTLTLLTGGEGNSQAIFTANTNIYLTFVGTNTLFAQRALIVNTLMSTVGCRLTFKLPGAVAGSWGGAVHTNSTFTNFVSAGTLAVFHFYNPIDTTGSNVLASYGGSWQ